MAKDERHEKEYFSTDPVGADNQTKNVEPLPTKSLPNALSDNGSYSDFEKNNFSEKSEEQEDISQPQASRTLTTTTTATSALTVESNFGTATREQKLWYKRLNPLKRSKKPPVPKERILSREYGASFLSLLTFQWMAPIMSVGYQRPLELNDIWLVNPDRSAEILSTALTASFRRRVKRGDKYPLVWALHETLQFDIWLGGLCQLVSSVLQVISPFTLRYLISFAAQAYLAQKTNTAGPNIGRGIGLVIGITAMQVFQSLGTNHFIYRGQIVGAQLRAVLIQVIFEKAMKISGRAKAGGKALEDTTKEAKNDAEEGEQLEERRLAKIIRFRLRSKSGPKNTPGKDAAVSGDGQGWGNGKIINLMSTDTYRVDQAAGMMHLIWTSPVLVLITLVLLLINLTYSALAGFALLVIGMPLLTEVIKSLFHRRRRINKITDQRVSITQEILQSVRFVKYFGWESSFLERVNSINPAPSCHTERNQCRFYVLTNFCIYAELHYL